MVTASGAPTRGNRILDDLPPRERQRVEASVEHVTLVPGEVVCRAGTRIKHVFFPREGVLSLFASVRDMPDVGVGIVGTDGMFGLAVAAGRATSALSAVSQGTGAADRIEARRFSDLLGQSAGLREAMLVYGYELSRQMAQNAACVLLHPAQRRLARWMLDVTSGSRSGRFSSTQLAMAVALGVQRPAVSRASGALQQLGLIRYLRGEVSIIDRAGLSKVACACSRSSSLRRVPM